MPELRKTNVLNRIEAEIPRLRRYARSLVRDADRADDLVQDCLVRAIDKIESWQEGTNLRAWLMTILRNKFLNDCRRNRVERLALEEHKSSSPSVVPANQHVQVFLSSFQDAFEALSPEHREALTLIAVEGFHYEEAAKIIGISVGTVKSRVSRARSNLKDFLENPKGTTLQRQG